MGKSFFPWKVGSFLALCMTTSCLLATNQTKDVEKNKESISENIVKLSEAFGHLIGKNIESLGIEFDIASVVKGIQDSNKGIESPMSETECAQALSLKQEEHFKQQSVENLEKANDFMEKNEQVKSIVSLEKGKLQYKIEKTGTGSEVQSHFSPLIRYTGKFMDGKVFGSSKEDEMISLDEAIPGFSKGLIGMKEGEIRTLYIHPELGYGTNGYLPPNSLLTFEVELIKANSPKLEEVESLSSKATPKEKVPSEIAESGYKDEAVR